MSFTYEAIGIIRTPHQTIEGVPIQSCVAKECEGSILLHEQYVDGLEDLEGFSHIILIYHLHKSKNFNLKPVPFLDTKPHGVFATRAPRRPNPIGISVVRLTGIHENVLEIENVDILDGTPLLDIKPYIPEFDAFKTDRTGWFEKRSSSIEDVKSDSRFKSEE